MNTKLFILGFLLMASTALVSAQCQGKGKGNGHCNSTCKDSAYVDNNKNGICDNYENRTTNVSGNQGKCKGNGNGQGKGNCKNFVDANKNGICDNHENRTKK